MKISKSNSIKASNIIQRLPIHQQLSKSQSLLSKISPIWSQWVLQNLPSELSNCYSPSHYSEGALLIECTNAVAATQLQQRQQSLLNYFHQQGIADIKTITARLTNISTKQQKTRGSLEAEGSLTAESSQQANNSSLRSNQLDNKSLDSIKSCQKQVAHQPLAASLGRLIKSIQKE